MDHTGSLWLPPQKGGPLLPVVSLQTASVTSGSKSLGPGEQRAAARATLPSSLPLGNRENDAEPHGEGRVTGQSFRAQLGHGSAGVHGGRFGPS